MSRVSSNTSLFMVLTGLLKWSTEFLFSYLNLLDKLSFYIRETYVREGKHANILQNTIY